MGLANGARVFIYSPFLEAVGGGERYFAETLIAIARRYLVTILVHSQQAAHLTQIGEIFAVEFSTVDVAVLQSREPYSVEAASEIAARVSADSVFFQFTNGEFVDVHCRWNIAHVQIVVPRSGDKYIPTDDLARFGHWLKNLDAVIYPSAYVLREMQRRYVTNKAKTHCLYPPLHSNFCSNSKPAPPPNDLDEVLTIVSVGRFVRTKKQDLIIEAFQKTL